MDQDELHCFEGFPEEQIAGHELASGAIHWLTGHLLLVTCPICNELLEGENNVNVSER